MLSEFKRRRIVMDQHEAVIAGDGLLTAGMLRRVSRHDSAQVAVNGKRYCSHAA